MNETATWSMGDSLRERFRHATGTPVEHDIRPYFDAVARVDAIDLSTFKDAELRARALELRTRARARDDSGDSLDDLLPDVFAVAREASARLLQMRPFDVQLAAGVALHKGCLAQLATGEGKTLVAVPPAILHALGGTRVHIFTANDYLARRDAEWMGPLYAFFGLRAASSSRV